MSEHTLLTGNDYGLAGVQHRALRQMLGNVALNFIRLVIADTTKKAVKYDDFDFTINGTAYEQSAATDATLTVLDYYGDTEVQAVSTTCFYLISVNSSGVENTVKGKDDETTYLPALPDTECLIGIIKIVTNSSTTFTIGTTDFDAAGITDTFYDYTHAPVTAP